MAKASYYVFSTLANDQKYQNYDIRENNTPIPTHGVLIKGGAGVANNRLMTPLGIVTEITDTDMDELNKNGLFLNHKNAGFLTVRPRNADPEKVAADMASNDKSAPMKPGDFPADLPALVK